MSNVLRCKEALAAAGTESLFLQHFHVLGVKTEARAQEAHVGVQRTQHWKYTARYEKLEVLFGLWS